MVLRPYKNKKMMLYYLIIFIFSIPVQVVQATQLAPNQSASSTVKPYNAPDSACNIYLRLKSHGTVSSVTIKQAVAELTTIFLKNKERNIELLNKALNLQKIKNPQEALRRALIPYEQLEAANNSLFLTYLPKNEFEEICFLKKIQQQILQSIYQVKKELNKQLEWEAKKNKKNEEVFEYQKSQAFLGQIIEPAGEDSLEELDEELKSLQKKIAKTLEESAQNKAYYDDFIKQALTQEQLTSSQKTHYVVDTLLKRYLTDKEYKRSVKIKEEQERIQKYLRYLQKTYAQLQHKKTVLQEHSAETSTLETNDLSGGSDDSRDANGSGSDQ